MAQQENSPPRDPPQPSEADVSTAAAATATGRAEEILETVKNYIFPPETPTEGILRLTNEHRKAHKMPELLRNDKLAEYIFIILLHDSSFEKYRFKFGADPNVFLPILC